MTRAKLAAMKELESMYAQRAHLSIVVNNLGNGLYETVAVEKGLVVARLTERRNKIIRRQYSVVH